jgi:hypothetical protein
MSASLFTADHNTYIKIVAVAHRAVAVIGIKTHVANTTSASLPTAVNWLVFKPADYDGTPCPQMHCQS